VAELSIIIISARWPAPPNAGLPSARYQARIAGGHAIGDAVRLIGRLMGGPTMQAVHAKEWRASTFQRIQHPQAWIFVFHQICVQDRQAEDYAAEVELPAAPFCVPALYGAARHGACRWRQ
jgi:hypothetical protein